MAEEKSKAELENKQPEEVTKSDKQPESKKADEEKVDIEKVLKENESLRQGQSTLTKSNATMQAELEAIKKGLSSIVSSDDPEDEKIDPVELVRKTQNQMTEMKRELAVDRFLVEAKDEDGEPVPSEIKTKALKLAKLDSLSPDEAVKELQSVVSELLELRDNSRTIKDKQPEASSRGFYNPSSGIKVFR